LIVAAGSVKNFDVFETTHGPQLITQASIHAKHGFRFTSCKRGGRVLTGLNAPDAADEASSSRSAAMARQPRLDLPGIPRHSVQRATEGRAFSTATIGSAT
jgi:hypothetical protein